MRVAAFNCGCATERDNHRSLNSGTSQTGIENELLLLFASEGVQNEDFANVDMAGW